MKILNIKVMRGPNYWSGYRKNLIVLKLDIEKLEDHPTNTIEGFADRLQALLPSLYTHRCSLNREGGFFDRVRAGTWMGHVIEHIALELQCLAGMEAGFGRTRSTKNRGVYKVVFSYVIEDAGIYAARAAVRLVEELLNNETAIQLEEIISDLKDIYRRQRFGPSTQSIIDEAERRNIPWRKLDHGSLILLGQGCNQKMVRATEVCTTSSIAIDIAQNKERTKKILAKAFVPVPRGELVYTVEDLYESIENIGFPLVVKPLDGNHGRGITTGIKSIEEAVNAFKLASHISEDVIIEQHIDGNDYRFLVINFKLVAVAKRTPAMVMGDGVSTIQQLIDETNADPKRGYGHESILTKIEVDDITIKRLIHQHLTLDSILPIGEMFFLKDTSNLSTGGTATDVTHLVHPQNRFMAERIARLINLDICGIDVVAKDINIPLNENTGAVVEVNAGPGFRMHLSPSKGLARNVAAPVIDMLYPNNAPSRIPIVAVTGTNGKTTTTRLIAHLASAAGHNVGYTTTDGIYINNTPVYYGDCSGPESAATILRDPIVDFAVLECARGGILRTGLGFDHCNVSIVTNITEDHLGIDDIETVDDLAKVKLVVPASTFKDGYAILNADDDLVYAMKDKVDCNVALFSLNPDNERIKTHCANGGLTAFIEKDYFTICDGEWKTRIAKIKEVPLTFSGTAECMVKNILPAILAAYVTKIDKDSICKSLNAFVPSPQFTPGRMNIFKLNKCTVMVDYAHNEDGFKELKKYVDHVEAPVKTGIIAATGDRREKDIRNVGYYAASMFDEIIIRHDKDNRGTPNEVLTRLLEEGISMVNSDLPITVISDEFEAVQYAIDHAKQDAFIVALTDEVIKVIDFLTRLQEYESGVSNLASVNK
ncbi:MAG: cphA [Bacteroidota bacterium]|nr:cphA [Bacteroidota bacterium]